MEVANNPSSVVVLEVGMHCESCASKVVECARRLKGVENVTVDIDSNKLTVEGEVDPSQIQEELSRKTNKKVDVVSSHHKIDDNGAIADKNKEDKKTIREENSDVDKKQPKQALETTVVVLKLGHYCQGCRPKIRKIVQETKGVQEMALDEENETITVKGTMDVKVLLEKLNRPVQILSPKKEKYSNGGDKDSGTGNDDRKKKKGSAQENGNRDTEMKGSLLELKPIEAPAIMAVFKVPLHCDGCIGRIRKIIRKIRGVQEVRINKEKETVTVKATIDVNTLTETMKKRLKKLVEERKIVIQKEAEVVKSTSQYSFRKQDHKQEIVPSTALQLAEQQQEIIQIICVQDSNDGRDQNQSLVSSTPLQLAEQQQEIIQTICVQDSNDGRDQNQSLVSSPDAHTKLDSEIGKSTPTTEKAGWLFILASLFLEGVSAVLDQMGHLKASMVLSFVALLLCMFDLFDSARREGLIKMERRGCSPCFCSHSTNGSPTSELFMVVQCFGFTSAVWQCIFSTVQYICALRHSDNPIKMTLLPCIFLLCVLISKLIRKMEELNCQDLEMGKLEPQRSGSSRKMEKDDQTSKTMETTSEAPTHASEDAFADARELGSGHIGCSHYRRRCKIRAPCCNEIFDCVHCHNEAKNSVETSSHDQHNIPSHEVIKVICTRCHTEQDVQQNCVSCGVCMGKYFCAKCIFFDDNVSKNPYHCNECRICRDRGRENYSHCKKCGSCYPKLMEDVHQD